MPKARPAARSKASRSPSTGGLVLATVEVITVMTMKTTRKITRPAATEASGPESGVKLFDQRRPDAGEKHRRDGRADEGDDGKHLADQAARKGHHAESPKTTRAAKSNQVKPRSIASLPNFSTRNEPGRHGLRRPAFWAARPAVNG